MRIARDSTTFSIPSIARRCWVVSAASGSRPSAQSDLGLRSTSPALTSGGVSSFPGIEVGPVFVVLITRVSVPRGPLSDQSSLTHSGSDGQVIRAVDGDFRVDSAAHQFGLRSQALHLGLPSHIESYSAEVPHARID